jgi:DNA-binding NarL/FixJ family response regulator
LTNRSQSRCAVLVIDEESLTLEALAARIAAIPDVIVTTHARWDDVNQMTDVEADVVVVDPCRSGRFGAEYLDVAKRRWPKARFMVLTNHAERDAIVSALAHGAHAFVLKSEPVETIRAAVELVCRGGISFSLSAASLLASEGIPATQAAAAGPSLKTIANRGLSPREVQVIQLVARGHPDSEIAALLAISPRTVERHMANILNKLDCRSRSQAVAEALGRSPPLARRAAVADASGSISRTP